MPIFQQLLDKLKKLPPDKQVELIDSLRKEKIKNIKEITKRDLIVYIADIKKNIQSPFGITNAIHWEDKTCFADVIEGLGEDVDIFIHSSGGSAEATESIVGLLRDNFKNVRFIVPNIAKSAATMMVLSGDEILMDDRSELGPIDPQILINGLFVPAQTIIDGFEEAKKNIIEKGPDVLPVYLPLLGKYDLHILQICENAINLSKKLVMTWLENYMFQNDKDAKDKSSKIAEHLADHREYLSHGRPVRIDDVKKLDLKIKDLRDSPELRREVWELYCILEILLDRSPVVKLYENSNGVFLVKQIPVIIQQGSRTSEKND